MWDFRLPGQSKSENGVNPELPPKKRDIWIAPPTTLSSVNMVIIYEIRELNFLKTRFSTFDIDVFSEARYTTHYCSYSDGIVANSDGHIPLPLHRAPAGGEISHLADKMDATALNGRLTLAEDAIKAVEVQLADVESNLLRPNSDVEYLREERKQLQLKERQLREEKRLFLEIILRQSPGQ